MNNYRQTWFFVLFCIAVFTVSGYTQIIVKIPKNSGNNLALLDKLQLPMIYQNDQELICAIQEKHLQHLKDLQQEYRILDQGKPVDSYFMLSHKKKKISEVEPSWGEIIYRDTNFALLQSMKISPEKLNLLGYDPVYVPQELPVYQNIQYRPPDGQVSGRFAPIDLLVNEINADSVRYFMQSLQDFQTRFLVVNNRYSIASWIKAEFESMGYTDVVLDSFQCHTSINYPPFVFDTTTWQMNVVATFPGTIYPDQVYLIGGHYDCITEDNPWVYAPGADDNASGTAAVLEVARALKAINFQPEATLKFVAFAAEELMYFGDAGSRHFAQQAASAGMDIRLMINNDMIANTFESLNNSRVGIGHYTGFEYFKELAKYLTNLYTVITPEDAGANYGGDSEPFYQQGYAALFIVERDFSPFYHTPGDTVGNCNLAYCAEVIKISGSTLIYSMITPDIVRNFRVADYGTGSKIFLSWSPNTEHDLNGYHIHLGLQSGLFDTVLTTTDTTILVDNLIEGTEYFIGLSAFDQDGNESMIVEKSITPYSIPLPPQNFSDEPLSNAIRLQWSSNRELDLAGYNLYRSENPASGYNIINTNLISDSLYTDINVQNGQCYHYYLVAVDSVQNVSQASDTVYSRNLSLDMGILVVDGTVDGDGSLGHPTDFQTDSFYTALATEFTLSHYDLIQNGSLKLADLGPYSTIIWHGDNMVDLTPGYEHQAALKAYLDAGGNLLISSYLPTQAFGHYSSYPTQLSPGDFLYDYLKISSSDFYPPGRFKGAVPLRADYDSVFVDATKAFSQLNFHLIKVEGIHSTPDADSIFMYHSDYASTTPMGSLAGMPVGIEYLGNDFQMVLMSFPLYYMNFEEAKTLISHILVDKFNETVQIKSAADEIPQHFALHQNYPNPFNPVTTIRFDLTVADFVTLKIYNLLGEEVTTLLSASLLSGSYSVRWNAGTIASGVYLYRFKAGEHTEMRKMVLMK